MKYSVLAASLAVLAFSSGASAADMTKQVPPQCKVHVTCPEQRVKVPKAETRPASAKSCATACLSEQEWANCPTKRWWASSAGYSRGAPGSWRTPYFYARCGTVCRSAGAPTASYNASTGRQVRFNF